ncbi:MAG: hypothetical protein FWF43_01240 [Propionibacteriaceae bacterium]|nr:hypothetical protein [Propionibacteriaceae bacterium]
MVIVLCSWVKPSGHLDRLARRVLLFSTVAVVWSLYLWFSREQTTDGASEFIALVVGSVLLTASAAIKASARDVRIILSGWLVSYIFVFIVGAVEFLTGRTWDTGRVVEEEAGVSSVFYNPNLYSFFLVSVVPLMFVGRKYAQHQALRIVYTISIASAYVMILATKSTLGVILMVTVALVFLGGRRIVVLLLFGQALLIASYFFFTPDSPGVGFISQWLHSSASVDARFALCGVSFQAGVNAGFLGLGPAGIEPFLRQLGLTADTYGLVNPHCGFGEIFSNYGIFVLLLLVWLLVEIFRIAWSGVRGEKGVRWTTARALLASTSIYVLMTTMNSSYIVPAITWSFLFAMIMLGRGGDLETRAVTAGPSVLRPQNILVRGRGATH